MDIDEAQKGKRYSHIYVERGEPQKDSEKARFRLATTCEYKFGQGSYFASKLEREIGSQFNSWKFFFKTISIKQMLDSITIIAGKVVDEKREFISEAKRIFREENLAYEIDEEGGVHPSPDSEFSKNTASAIAALGADRYTATRGYVERVEKYLLEDPSDYANAIYTIFMANENLFKMMFPKTPRLGKKEVETSLSPMLDSLYAHDNAQKSANAKMLTALTNWIDAAHNYRHADGKEKANQPDEAFAILMISQGLSFVRWLAQLDEKSNGGAERVDS